MSDQDDKIRLLGSSFILFLWYKVTAVLSYIDDRGRNMLDGGAPFYNTYVEV